jgi:hypothetical protein
MQAGWAAAGPGQTPTIIRGRGRGCLISLKHPPRIDGHSNGQLRSTARRRLLIIRRGLSLTLQLIEQLPHLSIVRIKSRQPLCV